MKALLAGVFLVASPLHAQPGGNCVIIDCPTNFMPSPGAPSSAGRQKVASALIAVQDAEKNEAAASRNLETSIDAVRLNLEKPYLWLPRWALDRLVTDAKVRSAALSDRDYLLKQEELRTAIAENYKAHNAAILAAATEYQLFPPVTNFTGDPRAAGVNMVAKPWLPKYSRHEKRDDGTGQWRKRNAEELAEEQQANAIVGGGVAAAMTRGDGVMELYGQAFGSPEDLAINIYHETSHWIDIAGKSGGFKQSDPPVVSFRTEQHAYERAAAFSVQLGLNPDRQLKMAAQFKLQADQSQAENLRWDQIAVRHPNWIGRDRKGLLAMAPADPEISAGDEALLQKNMAEAQRLVAEHRESRELQEEFQRRIDALPPPIAVRAGRPGEYPEGAIRVVPTRPRNVAPIVAGRPPISGLQFNYIASRACSAPPQSVDREMASVDWALFQKDQIDERSADGLSACQSRVVLRLIALGRTWRPGVVIGANEVRAAAAEPSSGGGGWVPPTQDHDPVWGKIGPIIGR